MKIYAHRGASAHFPEHTKAAYLAAIDHGADGFECDVRLTKENEPILWHDADMKRCAGNPARIAELTLSQIKSIYPEVMHLQDFLEIAREHNKAVAIETKHPVPSASRIEKVLIQTLTQEELSIDVAVMSFSWLALENIKKLNPKQRTVALLSPMKSPLMQRFTSAQALGPSIETFRKNPNLKKTVGGLFVWTVDGADDMRFCADNGVEVLITNTPSHAREVLGYH